VSTCHGPNNPVIVYYSEVLLQGLREFWQFLVCLINLFYCVGHIAIVRKLQPVSMCERKSGCKVCDACTYFAFRI
jgi:hypothetical protein